MEKLRDTFTGKVGFVLAASASAVGLGNLWRFPYLTSHYGGGIFVLVYIILAITFGLSLLMAEIAIGRKTGKSCIGAFRDFSEKHRYIGILIAFIPALIVPYYCVIGGWVTGWFFESVTGNLSTIATPGYWWSFVTGGEGGLGGPTLWFAVFTLMCIGCIVLGVTKGIEKVSRVLMPVLLILIIGITAYEMTLPGIWDGISFYLSPDLSKLSASTLLGAISQIFYSMSIAMGIMITYGSYMKKEVSIEKSAFSVCAIDMCVALLAGLMIVPSAFLFGFGDSQGMGLMFSSLPQVFAQMPGGEFVAPVFYLTVIFAAMTSAVSLLETVVSVVFDRLKDKKGISKGASYIFKRKKSVLISSFLLIALGLFVTFGFPGGPFHFPCVLDQGAGWLGIFDSLTNSILMPITAILTCLFIGIVVKIGVIDDEIDQGGTAQFRLKPIFNIMIQYICPIILTVILVTGLMAFF